MLILDYEIIIRGERYGVFDALKRIHEPRFAEKQTALNGELMLPLEA